MAITKQICLLDIRDTTPGFVTIRCCFWFPVTGAYPEPNFVSSYPDVTTDPNAAGIAAALTAGTLIEEVYSFTFPTSAVDNSWSTVELILLAYYNARKNYRAGTASVLPDPGSKLGTMYDSATGWSA